MEKHRKYLLKNLSDLEKEVRKLKQELFGNNS